MLVNRSKLQKLDISIFHPTPAQDIFKRYLGNIKTILHE